MFTTQVETNTQWALAAFVSIVCWYIVSSVVSWYRLRHVPGPFLASFSYLWVGSLALSGKQYETHLEIHRKYGSMVRVGPNEVLSEDIELLRKINAARSSYAKGASYSGSRLNPYHESLFMMASPTKHDKMKSKLIPGYSGREMPDLESNIDEQIQNLIQLIRDRYISKSGEFRPLLWSKVASLFTLDVISRISLGREFGCLRSDSDIHEFHDIMKDYLPVISLTTDVPWLRRIVFSPTFLKLFGPSTKDQKGIGKMMKLCNDVVDERYSGDGKDTEDILVSFVFVSDLSR
jgi:cytochrome P450